MAARLKLVLSESDINKTDNTSKVTAKLYYYGNGASFNYDARPGTIVIDGTSYSFSHSFTTSESAQLLATKTKTVTHNSDGKKTVSVSASFKTGVSLGTLKTSASKVLSTIPRVSTLSLNKTSVPADGSTTVIATATKQSSSFTDTITVTLGSYSKTVTSGTAFTIPMEWINAISGTSAKATVKVTTKSGSTTIGSATKSLTITVPNSVKPVINSVTIEEAVSTVTTAFGSRFVKGLSQLNITVDASGVYGSSIVSYSTSVGGVTYIQNAFTSGVLRTTGTVSIKAKVTDSRNRSTEYTKTITVIDYESPTITSLTYKASGNDLIVSIGYKVYPVENQNTKALTLSYGKLSDSDYTEKLITVTDWSGTATYTIQNVASDATYEFIATVSDKIRTSKPKNLTTGVVALSLRVGGKGAAFFGEADEDLLKVNGDLTVTGDLDVGGLLNLDNKKYIRAKDTNAVAHNIVCLNSNNNLIIGYGMINDGSSIGDTYIYGKNIRLFPEVATTSFRPYYQAGDTVFFYITTAGYVTSSKTALHFTLPLMKPILGSPTVTASSHSDYGFIIRQDGSYTHGSSSSKYQKPSSYEVKWAADYIRVYATFSTTTNAVNNAPAGITWGGYITFS